MRSDTPQEVIIFMDFERKAVEHINTRFPTIQVTLHLFDTERRMMDVGYKENDLFIEFFLDNFGQSFIIFLKKVGADKFHFLRSARKAFASSKDFTLPFFTASSASASAFCQSKSLK